MTVSIRRIVLGVSLGFWAILPFAVEAKGWTADSSIRCNKKIIELGSSQYEAKINCGEPVFSTSYTLNNGRDTGHYVNSVYKRNGRTYELMFKNGVLILIKAWRL